MKKASTLVLSGILVVTALVLFSSCGKAGSYNVTAIGKDAVPRL